MSAFSSPILPILLVEDSADDAELISLELKRSGMAFSMACVDTERDFERALGDSPKVILCDFHLPRFSCERVLRIVAERCPGIPVIVVSRHITDDEAAAIVRLGVAAVQSKARLGDLPDRIKACLQSADLDRPHP